MVLPHAAESRSPLSIRRSFSKPISSDFLPRLALAVLVLFWSVAPLLPWAGSGSGVAGGAPIVRPLPAGAPVLVGRPDTTSRIAQWRPLSVLGLFDEAGGGEGDDASSCGAALACTLDEPLGAPCAGFVTAHHPVRERARRTLRRSGRAPPVAQRSA